MKKIIFLTFLFVFINSFCFGANFGMYKTETEYGLIDGFKWNFFNRKENQPLVQLKSETEEEKIRIENEKKKPKKKEEIDEVRMYRFMVDENASVF